MARPNLPLRRLFPSLLCAGLFWLAGCGDRDRIAYATETDEPYYKEGQSLLKTGRRQEALTAFLKVIDKRNEDAPESHLEIGLLYQQHINDPLSAIYHFKKYLALRPNSPQAPYVRQRIDGCIREFARTLPAQPLDTATKRVDLIAAMDKLKVENDQLKQQLADLKNTPAPGPGASTDPVVSPVAPVAANKPLSLDIGTVSATRPRRAAPAPAQPLPSEIPLVTATPRDATRTKPGFTLPTAGPAPAKNPAATSARGAARKHIVQKGDTLMNLAQKYYKDRAKWRDIYAANRRVMKNEGDLHVGMELAVP